MKAGTIKITFNEHQFAVELAKLWEVELRKGGFKQSNPKYDYLMKVNHQCEKIEQTLRTIQISRILVVERHSLVDVYSRIGTNDFLRYAIENFFLRITTYKDQILHLINEVLELGIEKKTHFEKKLKEKISSFKDIMDAIERTNLLFTSVRVIRNKIAHEGQLDNPDLYTLELNAVAHEYLPHYRSKIKQDSASALNKLTLENAMEMMMIEEELTTDFFSVLNILLGYFMKGVEAKEG